MNKRIVWLGVFLISLALLLISIMLFINMGVYVDEYNTTPSVVSGGSFWLMMQWLRLLLLFVLCAVSGIGVCTKNRV